MRSLPDLAPVLCRSSRVAPWKGPPTFPPLARNSSMISEFPETLGSSAMFAHPCLRCLIHLGLEHPVPIGAPGSAPCDQPTGSKQDEPGGKPRQSDCGFGFSGQRPDHENKEHQDRPAHRHATGHLVHRVGVPAGMPATVYEITDHDHCPHKHEEQGCDG